MTATAWFRGEGGGLHRFDLPLPPTYAEQHRKGLLVEVPDPNQQPTEPEPEAGDDPEQAPTVAPPDRAAPKVAWVDHATAQGMDRDQAQAMTKADLIARFGG